MNQGFSDPQSLFSHDPFRQMQDRFNMIAVMSATHKCVTDSVVLDKHTKAQILCVPMG